MKIERTRIHFLATFLLPSTSSDLFPEPAVSLGRMEKSTFRNATGDIEKPTIRIF